MNQKSKYKKSLPSEFLTLIDQTQCRCADAPYTYSHSHDSIDTNLLVVLHGMGDTHHSLHEFARKIQLPQTAILSLDACLVLKGGKGKFVVLPLDVGFTWFSEHDLSVDALMRGLAHENSSLLDLPQLSPTSQVRQNSLQVAISSIRHVSLALEKEWSTKHIFVFGYSCGASLAAEAALDRANRNLSPWGGIVCVAGGVKAEGRPSNTKRRADANCTPVLIISGSDDNIFTPLDVRTASKMYDHMLAESLSNCSTGKDEESIVRVFCKKSKRHDMIRSREEVEAMMQFFAKRLVRRMMGMEEQGWIQVPLQK